MAIEKADQLHLCRLLDLLVLGERHDRGQQLTVALDDELIVPILDSIEQITEALSDIGRSDRFVHRAKPSLGLAPRPQPHSIPKEQLVAALPDPRAIFATTHQGTDDPVKGPDLMTMQPSTMQLARSMPMTRSSPPAAACEPEWMANPPSGAVEEDFRE